MTSRIELFTGIALLIQRDPIITAKEAASIDLISGGRFVFGVGAGWNIEELRDHGTDPKTRGALLDERIEAIKALWTNEPAEYHGKFVDFDASYSRPKPVRHPAADLHRRQLRCDRQASDPPRRGLDLQSHARRRLAPRIRPDARRLAATTSRWRCSARPWTPDYWRAADDLGFGQVALMLPAGPRDEVLRLLDEYAAKVQQYRG